MVCPICESTDAHEGPKLIDGETIKCPNCGDYRITGTVIGEIALGRYTHEMRREALAMAKRSAAPGILPVVNAYKFDYTRPTGM
jgi:hypothetical protein